jgi:hypothetical protein
MTLREKIAQSLHDGSRDPIVEFIRERGWKTEAEIAAQRPRWVDEHAGMREQYLRMADRILAIPEIAEALRARNLLIASKLPHLPDKSVRRAIQGIDPPR